MQYKNIVNLTRVKKKKNAQLIRNYIIYIGQLSGMFMKITCKKTSSYDQN